MHPVILQFNPGSREIIIPAYGLIILVVFALSGVYLTLFGKRQGITPFYAWLIITMIFAFGHLGAVVWDQLISVGRMIFAPGSEIIGKNPGLAWFGALLFAAPLSYWFIRYNGFDALKLIDLMTPMLLVGYAIGRVGCLLGGCCYGRPTKLPWGITYPPGLSEGSAPSGIPLHPTPIYASLITLAVLALVLVFRKSFAKSGQIFAFAMGLHALGRFVVEFFRWDHGSLFFGLSLTQVISLLICITASVILAIRTDIMPNSNRLAASMTAKFNHR